MTIIKKALFCFVFCLICCGLYSKEDQRSNAKYVMVVSGKMKMKKKILGLIVVFSGSKFKF